MTGESSWACLLSPTAEAGPKTLTLVCAHTSQSANSCLVYCRQSTLAYYVLVNCQLVVNLRTNKFRISVRSRPSSVLVLYTAALYCSYKPFSFLKNHTQSRFPMEYYSSRKVILGWKGCKPTCQRWLADTVTQLIAQFSMEYIGSLSFFRGFMDSRQVEKYWKSFSMLLGNEYFNFQSWFLTFCARLEYVLL